MRRFLIFCLALMILPAICACSAGDNTNLTDESVQQSSPVSTQAKQYQIAFIMKTLTNPFFLDMETGARKAEKELNVKLIVKTGAQETSIEQQIQIVQEMILQKVDAIVIAPGSSVDLVKVLKNAQDAGIKIVNVDNQLDAAECAEENLHNVPFISVKNDDAAYLSAKAIASGITSPSKAVIVEGISDADNAQQRKTGAMKAFNENMNIRIVACETANWKIDEAHALAAKLFITNPDIKLVFCANDMMALGVVQYLKETNHSGVLVAGFDDLADTQTEIKNGWIAATIDQQAALQGYMGVETAVELIQGKSVDSVTYVPVKLITKENVQ